MPRYRFILPVRAIGGYRLPDVEIHADGVTLTPAANPAYTARIDGVDAENVELAYVHAQHRAEDFFSYLALLGDDAAFILDGREGVQARNVDLEQNPFPGNQAPPPFESLGGGITDAGQEHFAALLDPSGEKRRTGAIAIHNAQAVVVPGQEQLDLLCGFFANHDDLPIRLRTALGIIHDAACSREPASGFAQSFTALEVLTADVPQPTVLDRFYTEADSQDQLENLQFKTKKQLLAAFRKFLENASIPSDQAERIANYAATSRSTSQVDVFFDYLVGLNLTVTREELAEWRRTRGALVHAAEADEAQSAAMRRFRGIVRNALTEELNRL